MSTRAGFLERNVAVLAATLDRATSADESSRRAGLLQGLDPRTKLVGLIVMIIVAAGSHRLGVVGALFGFAVVLAVLSGVSVRRSLLPLWAGVIAFTGLIALPAVFLPHGRVVFILPVIHWQVTGSGFLAAARLITRAETTATFAGLLVLTTPWPQLLKALRVLRVPRVAVVILGMTHRYIHLLLGLARDYFVARRCREAGRLNAAQRRHIATATAGVLLERSLALSGDVFLAMQSRGFRGEVHLLEASCFGPRDAVAGAVFAAVAIGCCV